MLPSPIPSEVPTPEPTEAPTLPPTPEPSESPTHLPTLLPTATPTPEPSQAPSHLPTLLPTAVPTHLPTLLPSGAPTFSPTTVGEPEGANFGLGCSYVCDDNFDAIMGKFDEFQTYIYATLNASFVDVKEDLDEIFEDASAMLVAKVHQKTAQLSHHAAKIDATHRVLLDLLASSDVPGDTQNRGLFGSGESEESPELVEEALEVASVVRHKDSGVLWSTFALQGLVAFVGGLVLESYRLRKEAQPLLSGGPAHSRGVDRAVF